MAGNTENKLANSILLVPDYEAIVVAEQTGYGLINSEGKELIPSATQNFYTTSSAGVNSYFLTYQGNVMNVLEYLKAMGFKPVNEEKKITVADDEDEKTNKQNNENKEQNNTNSQANNQTNENTETTNEVNNNTQNKETKTVTVSDNNQNNTSVNAN